MTNPFEDETFGNFDDARQFLTRIREAIASGDISGDDVGTMFHLMEVIVADDHEDKIEITGPLLSALYAMGGDALAECIKAVDLIIVENHMALGITGRRPGDEVVKDAEMQEKFMHALRGVLQAHGLPCRVYEGKLQIQTPPGDPWMEAINEFSKELDEMDDPMSKWYKPKHQQGETE